MLGCVGHQLIRNLFNNPADRKLDQQILKTYDIGPDVVVCIFKIYIDLKIFKCRFYEYTDEAVEFRTCSKTAGTCTEIQFSNVSNTIYRVMDGETDATATTQTCQKKNFFMES